MAIYLANDKYNATLTQTYTVGDNTLYVDSVPNNVPTIVVAEYNTPNETVFAITGKTSNALTGVTRLRGANVNLNIGAKITCLNNEEFINQFQSAGFEGWLEVNDNTTINFDISLARKQIVTIAGNRTLNVSNVNEGATFLIAIKQDSTGGRTVNWWNNISWPDGVAPVLTPTASKTDIFGFIKRGSIYYGVVIGQNF